MIKRRNLILAGILAATMCLSTISASAATIPPNSQKNTHTPSYEEGEAIVLLKDTKSSMSRKATAAALEVENIQVKDTCNFKQMVKEDQIQAQSSSKKSAIAENITTIALIGSSRLSTEKLVDKLKKDENVEIAVPNYHTKAYSSTNDQYSKYQWALENTGQSAGISGNDLHPEVLWSKGTTGSSKVVAIIDSGVDYTHEDLKSNMWINPHQDRQQGKYGYDFTNNDADPMDDDGHGTHCAGIIGAAGNNKIGISGINQKVKLMALKCLGPKGGDFYDSLAAYEYISDAQDMGVDIAAINNSYGLSEPPKNASEIKEVQELNKLFKTVMDIVGKKGAVSLCAAGNESSNNDNKLNCPSGADSPYSLSIAASDSADRLAPYSNYGRTSVDLAAPGSEILSTYNENCFVPGIYKKEAQKELCSEFADYEETNKDSVMWGIPEVVSSQSASMSLDTETFFSSGKQSLKVDFGHLNIGDIAFLEIPYQLTPTTQDIYASFAFQGSKLSGQTNSSSLLYVFDKPKDYDTNQSLWKESDDEWNSALMASGDNSWWFESIKTKAGKSSTNQERKLILAYQAIGEGNHAFHLDQLGISKENVNPSKFGKYMFLDGTSMACPYVTGSAALIAASDPGMSALEVVSTLKKSVRKTASMTGKVASGGILDLSKLSKPQSVASIKLNKTSAKVKKGSSFTLKAAISPSAAAEKNVIWSSSNSKVASVDHNGKVIAKGYGKANITAASAGKGHKAARCAVTVGYTIGYKTNGGKLSKGSPALYYNESVSLKKPARSGYSFSGWYTDKKCKKKIATIKKGTKKNYILYAKWSKIKVGKTYIKRISKKRSPNITLSYKKVRGAHGYQIKYSRSKSFTKKSSKYVNTKSTKKKIAGLKKDTVYYVKVRAYKYDSTGKKLYGKYSSTVRIR